MDSQKDFFAGSIVGLMQMLAGVAITGRYGYVAGFFMSSAIYVISYKLYRWALK